jgi:hypothetical protein
LYKKYNNNGEFKELVQPIDDIYQKSQSFQLNNDFDGRRMRERGKCC